MMLEEMPIEEEMPIAAQIKGFEDLDEYSKLKIFQYLDGKSVRDCFGVCKE